MALKTNGDMSRKTIGQGTKKKLLSNSSHADSFNPQTSAKTPDGKVRGSYVKGTHFLMLKHLLGREELAEIHPRD